MLCFTFSLYQPGFRGTDAAQFLFRSSWRTHATSFRWWGWSLPPCASLTLLRASQSTKAKNKWIPFSSGLLLPCMFALCFRQILPLCSFFPMIVKAMPHATNHRITDRVPLISNGEEIIPSEEIEKSFCEFSHASVGSKFSILLVFKI